MTSLHEIDVRAEGRVVEGDSTHNLLPVLHQLQHALRLLCDRRESTIIDLTAMPFGPGEEAQLRGTLGCGEATASVNAIGVTEIRETAFSGIWLVEHRSPEDARVALHIEVAEVPFLLRTPQEDLEAASRRLQARLSEFDVRHIHARP